MVKFNKLAILSAAALALSACSIAAAFADPQITPPPQQRGMGGKIAKLLNLTDDQKAQLKPIIKNARDQFNAIRTDTTLTPDQKKAKIQALKAQVKAQVDQILTPAQQQQLAALKAKVRQNHGQPPQQPANP